MFASLGLLLAYAFLCGMAWPGDMPHGPRLAPAGSGGAVAGGYQMVPGPEGAFELFISDADGVTALGRYNGRLAGVAVDAEGRFLALTADGALGVYGGNPETIAFPDSRWNMLGLVWHDGRALAVHHDGEFLRLLRLDPDGQTWRDDGGPVAAQKGSPGVMMISLDDGLHLLWAAAEPDLSGGAVRHMVLESGSPWRELPPAPLGDVRYFTAFGFDAGLELIARAVDPLAIDPDRLAGGRWSRRDGTWTAGDMAKRTDAELFRDAADAMAVAEPSGSLIVLVTGADGAVLVRDAPSGQGSGLARERYPLAYGGTDGSAWSDFTGLFLAAGVLLLVFLSCRRSLALSGMMPGRVPDLTSRAVAISIDWFLVSVAITAYHIAAGDMRVFHELLTVDSLNRMFWLNIGALILFTTVMETVYGCTPGKYLTGLRVRSVFGGPPRFMQILVRNAMRGIDMFPVLFPGLPGMLTAMLNVRRQRLGDIIGGTMVRRHCPAGRRSYLLASASPRRKELLEALGLDFRVEPVNIDESDPSLRGVGPDDTVRRIAEAKTRAAMDRVSGLEVVVAADTVVVLDGDILGKPVDAADAARMLGRLSGRSHTVLTGVSVFDPATGQGLSDVEQTEVEFRILSDREIEAYVATGDPMDKAGGYGVQSAARLVREVRGSFSNVAGLPMEMLRGMLSLLDS